MKFQTLLSLMLFVFLAFTACESDDDENASENDEPTNLSVQDDYFEVQGASYSESEMPSASGGPSIANISGNQTVLAGGGNPVSVEPSSDSENLLIGVQSVNGYYSYGLSRSKATNTTYTVYLQFTQGIDNIFIIVFALEDGNGNVGDYETIEVETQEAGTGKLQVSLSWDQLNDMDLHLIEPDEERIYYANSTSSNGGMLDVDSNPGCSIDSINNENISYPDTANVEAGTYQVIVDRYSNCYIENPTNFSVSAFLDGQLINTNPNPYTTSWAADHENDDEVVVMEFQIGSSKLKNLREVMSFDYGRFEKPRVLSPQKLQ